MASSNFATYITRNHPSEASMRISNYRHVTSLGRLKADVAERPNATVPDIGRKQLAEIASFI